MPGGEGSSSSPQPASKSFWDEHFGKAVTALVVAVTLGIYQFAGWAICAALDQRISEAKEIMELVDSSEKNEERLKLLEEDLKRLEQKIDLQTEFLKKLIGEPQ